MRRVDVISWIVHAGFHRDSKAAVRVAVEHRVSRLAMNEAFKKGRAMFEAGRQCDCDQCKPGQP